MPRQVRRRYVAVKVDSEQNIDERDVIAAVYDSLLDLFGEYGASIAELVFIDYDPKTNYAILRCNHKALEMVKASIVAVKEMGGKKTATQIINVSGTIKALRKRLTT